VYLCKTYKKLIKFLVGKSNMVDKISQNLKYSNNAEEMCRKDALSVARLREDAEKYAFAMQLSDYQAFTPPPQLTDNQ
jgi:hypothetical protein